jgi:hypothetical protein
VAVSAVSLADHQILGLTVRSPWAELIARGIKTIENRSWAPPEFMLGRYLAIHASATWDDQGAQYLRDHHERFAIDPPMQRECVYGVIAVARLVGWVRRGEEPDRRPRVVKILPGFEFGANLDALGHSIDWRWFMGGLYEYGWVLRDVKRIAPVACAGRLRLWPLPKFVYRSVRERWAKAA